ncbi:MAG: metallophosphoesterase [Flavobacteriaceae bacterium]|nr:metallophosphoesterase [Flavobacteriaceae bacterium]
MTRWIFFLIFFLLSSFYASQALRTLQIGRWVLPTYWLICAATLAFIYYQLSNEISVENEFFRTYAIGAYIMLFVFQSFLVLFLFSEDIFRIVRAIISFFNPDMGPVWASRRKFVSQLALGVAAVPTLGLLYGIFKGKYNYKVLRYTLTFDDLPDAFDGFQIAQVSDFHCGSFDNRARVQYGIDLVNKQEADVIVFTGDIVNNRAVELEPWKKILGTLSAKNGVYSVLGNHDYGDYYPWDSEAAKADNLTDLVRLQKEMGYQLLRNEHAILEKEGSHLAIVGVENWGTGGFKKAGDLNAALSGLDQKTFKILLSHDPSHWQVEVKEGNVRIPLTLSGHTHGMQFGIEIPGLIKWSPVKWRYPYWAGVYKENNRFLNVNRGFGFLAYPGRFGIWPEISVITLKKSV